MRRILASFKTEESALGACSGVVRLRRSSRLDARVEPVTAPGASGGGRYEWAITIERSRGEPTEAIAYVTGYIDALGGEGMVLG